MNTEQLLQLEERFSRMSNQALTQFAKPYICQTIHSDKNNKTEREAAGAVLDLIYTECTRRGIEKLYDMTYEAVSKHPEICNAA